MKTQGPETPCPTHITIVLDRSGSMGLIADEAGCGFSHFLQAQRALSGQTTASLVTFNDALRLVWDSIPIHGAPTLDRESYVPGGDMVLLDAIGFAISHTSASVRCRRPIECRPKIIIAVLTDGLKNSSCLCTHRQVAARIRRRREKRGWEFVFLATFDAIEAAAALGIDPRAALTFCASKDDIRAAWDSLSQGVSTLRTDDGSGTGFGFIEADRQNQSRPRRRFNCPPSTSTFNRESTP